MFVPRSPTTAQCLGRTLIIRLWEATWPFDHSQNDLSDTNEPPLASTSLERSFFASAPTCPMVAPHSIIIHPFQAVFHLATMYPWLKHGTTPCNLLWAQSCPSGALCRPSNFSESVMPLRVSWMILCLRGGGGDLIINGRELMCERNEQFLFLGGGVASFRGWTPNRKPCPSDLLSRRNQPHPGYCD